MPKRNTVLHFIIKFVIKSNKFGIVGDFFKKYENKSNVIGTLLLEHRLKLGLSKEEVCRRVQLHGVYIHRVELYRMEKEISIIKDFELIALCEVLGINYNNEVRKLID